MISPRKPDSCAVLSRGAPGYEFVFADCARLSVGQGASKQDLVGQVMVEQR